MMNRTTSFFGRIAPALFLVVLSVFAWAPLLNSAYFFQAHDAPHSIFFLVGFDQTLRDGFLWPRWAPDFAFGYGYPLFNIYAPLAFYAAELWHLVGFGLITSVKIMYALATVLSGLAMYGFANRLFGRAAGLVAGVVYIFIPFHLAEIYVRSAYPEYVALALLPANLWAFDVLIDRPSLRSGALAALAFGILALTHHALLFTFTPLLVVYILFLVGTKWRSAGWRTAWSGLWAAVAAGALGACLGAIYLLPLIAEAGYVKVSQWTAFNYAYQNHFVYPGQFLSPFWGHGYSGPGLQDGMPFQLGVVPVGLVLVAVVLLFGRLDVRLSPIGDIREGSGYGQLWFFLGILVVTVWLMTPAAALVWEALPIASLVQFPWRLLGLAMLAISVVVGGMLSLVCGRWEGAIAGAGPADAGVRSVGNTGELLPVELSLLALVVALGSFTYTLPKYTEVEDWRETPRAVVEWDRFSPADRVAMVIYTDEQPTTGPMEAQYLTGEPLDVAGVIAGQGSVETVHHGGASDEILVWAVEPVVVQFYTYDYPGWRVTMDGELVPHRNEPPHGLITVDVPAGEHRLLLRMGPTPPRIAGSVLSLGAMLLVVTGLAASRIWSRRGRLL
jgi:hypothetical protein